MNSAHILASSIAEKITLPEVYHRIRYLITDPDVTIDDFIDVINLDTSLAIHIVKIANSDFFDYARKAETVKQALSLIGIMQLHDLILSNLAIRAFSGIPSVLINQQAFWRSCIYCGIVAKLLAKKCMLPAGEKLFALGLLYEIGHLVMYAKIPEQIQDIIINAQQGNVPLYMLERKRLGFDYGQVGSEVMRIWQLPDSYSDIAMYHLEPEKSQHYQQEIAIVNLARAITLEEDLNSVQPLNALLKKLNELFDTQIRKEDIITIQEKAQNQVDEVISYLI